VFPCGYTIASDGDTINLYYGSADSSIALAHGSVRSPLIWLDANGHSDEQHDRRHLCHLHDVVGQGGDPLEAHLGISSMRADAFSEDHDRAI
jgi:hypothetical protein